MNLLLAILLHTSMNNSLDKFLEMELLGQKVLISFKAFVTYYEVTIWKICNNLYSHQ